MQVVTKTKTEPISREVSLTVVKNLFRASFSSIAYVRGLFPDECFMRSKMGETKYRKLLASTDEGVQRFSEWLEQGVFDALTRKYLEVVLLEIYDGTEKSKLLECFSFGVEYSDDGASFSLGTGDTSNHTEAIKDNLSKSTSVVIRKLIELCGKLKPLPSKRVISMKLLYTKNTPDDYEPPLFEKDDSKDVAWFAQKPTR